MAYSDRNALLQAMAGEDPDGSGNFSWAEFAAYIDVMITTVAARKKEYKEVGC